MAKPLPAQPVPGGSISHRRRVLGAVLTCIGATVIVGFLLATAYSLAVTYGSESIPWLSIFAWAAVPAVVVAFAARLVARAYDREGPSMWVLLAGSLTLVVAATAGATALGEQRHSSNMAIAAAACSPADLAVFEAIPGYDVRQGAPDGASDGGCWLMLPVRAEADAALPALETSMTAAGWVVAASTAETRTFTKDGATIVATRRDTSKGYTDVALVIPAG